VGVEEDRGEDSFPLIVPLGSTPSLLTVKPPGKVFGLRL